MPLKTKSTDQIKRITFFISLFFIFELSWIGHKPGLLSPHRVFYCFIKDYLLYYKTRENINWIVLSSFFGKAAYNNLEICFNLIFLLLQNISLFCWFFSPSHFEPHFTGSVIFNNGRSDIDHFPPSWTNIVFAKKNRQPLPRLSYFWRRNCFWEAMFVIPWVVNLIPWSCVSGLEIQHRETAVNTF